MLGPIVVRSVAQCCQHQARGAGVVAGPILHYYLTAGTRVKNKSQSQARRIFDCLFSTDATCTNLDEVVQYMKNKPVKRIAVMAGAGISTQSGIPDFRTPGTGLYDNLQKYELPYAEAIFDIDYFAFNPKPFYCLAEEIYPSGKYRPNTTHYFIRLLHEKGLLKRFYTQNIDGLERLAGIPPKKLVEAHGTFATAHCQTCRKSYTSEDIEEAIFSGLVPKCSSKTCQGVVKPDIVFFGEQLPNRFYYYMVDMPQADLLIVMGSSLEVYPFAGISEAVLAGVPRVLFNREVSGSFLDNPRKNDVFVPGDLVVSIGEFAEKLGWGTELQNMMDRCVKELSQYISAKSRDVKPAEEPP